MSNKFMTLFELLLYLQNKQTLSYGRRKIFKLPFIN